MKTFYTLISAAFIYLLITAHTTLAQNDLNKKINDIDGTIDKITITSDGKEYLFEDKDAEKLFKKMKSNQVQSFVWNSSDDSIKKVIILDATGNEDEIEVNGGDDNVVIIKTNKGLEDIDDGITKKIKVDVEDGNKKVTVTTKENGQEKTEVYEGKEAEEYIEKMKAENGELDISVDTKSEGKKIKKIIIETEKDVE
jgi:hypothetical protein